MVNIVVLTGAGISAEYGLPTYRGPGGLWEGRRGVPVTAADQQADPAAFTGFWQERAREVEGAMPNAAHAALARLEHALPGRLTLITQNIDALHEAAGSKKVLHLHGRIDRFLCASCSRRCAAVSACPACGSDMVRPDVVLFGERPRHLDAAFAAVDDADIFVAVGTSCNVQPAALLPRMAWSNCMRPPRSDRMASRARVIEINSVPTGMLAFDEVRAASAAEAVPALVAELIDRCAPPQDAHQAAKRAPLRREPLLGTALSGARSLIGRLILGQGVR